MMYNQKMVCCLKANGKVLREFKDTIYVPYGQEYSLLIKNLNSVRAIVKVEIDGQSVCNDGFSVNANSELDIERFVKDLNKGNRFKFIERTAKIEDGPRGIKAEDGLIRVSFHYEKVLPKTTYVDNHIYHRDIHHYPYRWPYYHTTDYCGSPMYGGLIGNASNMESKMAATCSTNASVDQEVLTKGTLRSFNNVGITVPGSLSEQKFKTVEGFPTEEEEHVMVIRLLGEDPSGKVVKAPVTVKAKPKCQTCGRNNKATSKFCVDCGTALEVI